MLCSIDISNNFKSEGRTSKNKTGLRTVFRTAQEQVNNFVVIVRVALDCGSVVVDARLVGLASQGIPVP